MSDHLLPQEVFIEILLRLPLKTLIKCTSVCKSWNSLIKSPNFISTHLNHRNIASTSTDLLFLRRYSENEEKERYSLRFDNTTLDEYSELECPFKCKSKFYLRIVGSCNGVLCLSDDLMGYRNFIILWNLSIKRFITLPFPRITYRTHGGYFNGLGFGFDVKSNDYKVVRLVYLEGDNDYDIVPPEVEIYTLSTGTWRGISACGPRFNIFDGFWTQAFVNGAVHWLGYDQHDLENRMILVFDMGYEVFREIMLPINATRRWIFSIAVFGELLSVFEFDRSSRDNCCAIWVMKEYGVEESWTKQFSIDVRHGLGRPIFLRKDGEILMATTNEMIASYHPKTHRCRDLGICGAGRGYFVNTFNAFYVDTYMESLVLLDRVNGDLGALAESSNADTCEDTSGLLGENDGVERTETMRGKEE